VGNPYYAIHVDVLHQSDTRIFKFLVQCLWELNSQGNVLQARAL